MPLPFRKWTPIKGQGAGVHRLSEGSESFYPEQIVIDPSGSFAYVGDAFKSSIAVIDLRPDSPKFHEVVRRINLPASRNGISSLVVNPKGDRLFVALRNDMLEVGETAREAAPIVIVDINPYDAQSPDGLNSKRWTAVATLEHEHLGMVPAGLSAAVDPKTGRT